jgi:hypothetical protein
MSKNKKKISYIDILLVLALILFALDVFNLADDNIIAFIGFVLLLTLCIIVLDFIAKWLEFKIQKRNERNRK